MINRRALFVLGAGAACRSASRRRRLAAADHLGADQARSPTPGCKARATYKGAIVARLR
jgi:hypothetical protein